MAWTRVRTGLRIDRLSNEMIGQYRDTFQFFDKNGDGQISSSELCKLLVKLMGAHPTEATLQAKHMINAVDNDGSGTVDFDEFCTMMERTRMQKVQKDEIRNTFQLFDKDSDGFISQDELRNAMTIFKIDLTEEELGMLVQDADTNGDGQLNYQEFASLLMA